jgi:cation:H+ antiporter
LISRYKGNERWRPDPTPDEEPLDGDGGIDNLRRAILLTCGFAAVIVSAGYVLAKTGEAIAHQSGLGENFVGATLVGATTSLPEISTVITAVRIRRYMLAFSDIFGTNLFDCSLIFLIDAVYSGPPVLNEVGTFSSAFGALLGIIVTLMYVSGLIERRDKTMFRLGIDSWAVLGVYLGGLAILYSLR